MAANTVCVHSLVYLSRLFTRSLAEYMCFSCCTGNKHAMSETLPPRGCQVTAHVCVPVSVPSSSLSSKSCAVATIVLCPLLSIVACRKCSEQD
jgi:hypothetical protein